MSEHERHLTEEMLLHVQTGDASDAERAHLAGCQECQQQAEPLSDALRWFGAAAREFGAEKAALAAEWRESKAAMVQDWREGKASANQEWREARVAAAAHRRSFIATWAAVAAVLLLMFGIGLPRWQQHRAAVTARAEQQRQQALTEDDALLEEVDQDVSQVVPDAMQPLSLNSSSSSSSTTGSTRGSAATRQ
jgi:hypothetical protein